MQVLVFAQIFLLMFLANAVVYGGVFFINGVLLPSWFAPLYAHTGVIIRTAICLVTFLLLGNILFTVGFAKFNPVLVAPLNIIAFVLVQIMIGVILSKSVPDPMLIPAMAVVVAGAMWVYVLINGAAPKA